MARALAPISSYPGIFYFQTSQPAPPKAALAPLCRQKGGGGEKEEISPTTSTWSRPSLFKTCLLCLKVAEKLQLQILKVHRYKIF